MRAETTSTMRSCQPPVHQWLVVARLLLIALLVAIPALASASSRGEIGDRIYANGFELPQSIGEVERLPAPDSLLPADSLPQIGLRLLDSQLSPSGWRLYVDGENRTELAEVTVNSILYTPDEPLFEGAHTVEIRNHQRSWIWDFRTSTPPEIFDMLPVGQQEFSVQRPEIEVSFSDIGAGIDLDSISFMLDWIDVTDQAIVEPGRLRFIPDENLKDGTRVAWVQVSDLAGSQVSQAWTFYLGEAPQVEFLGPGGHVWPFGSHPEIVARATVSRGEIDPQSLQLTLEGVNITTDAEIELEAPNSAIIRYQPHNALDPGEYFISLGIAADSGSDVLASQMFYVDVERLYQLELISPSSGTTSLVDHIDVVVRAGSSVGPAREVRIDGARGLRGALQEGHHLYSHELVLEPGYNTILVRALFMDGAERDLELKVYYEPAPRIIIQSPDDWTSFGPHDGPDSSPRPGSARDLTGIVQRPITITGNSVAPVVAVQVNQQQSVLGEDGLSFTFPNYFLREGSNHLSAVATDSHGRIASDQITVYVDQTAPLLTIESPTPDTVISSRMVDVRGLVTDAVQAPVGTAVPRLLVSNSANDSLVEAVVAGDGYVAQDVALEVGLNRLEVTALDQHGNARSRSVNIVRTLAGTSRLFALSGNRQQGAVDTLLPQPLVVQALDADGWPIAGLALHVDILRGSGAIHATPDLGVVDGLNPPRHLVLNSDAEGMVQLWLRLGVEARPGSDVVRFWSTDLAEEVVFSATAETAPPHSVHIFGSSGMQYAAIDSTPIEALMVQVHDALNNPLPGNLVEFNVTSGPARFIERSAPSGVIADEGRTITVQADRNGVAVVRPQLAGGSGAVRIKAEALTDTDQRIGPVVFHLVVNERQNGPTRLAGVVFDHTGTPLAGVRLSIDRTALSVVTDESGYFEFADQVPSGKIDLFVDGREVRFQRDGSMHEYPALHFEASVIQGQLNQLPHAIYLPPIDLSQAQIVGGNEDVILTLQGFEGFQMRVKANSVTFPDGSRAGPLVIAPVHNDRLPMVPLSASGRFETVGWTIQPTNTRFDPPIEVTIPNTSGLLPGRIIPIQQWDHDLALFVPMGTGTVSEDGTAIVSDKGSGITKAGWGGGVPPPPPPNTGCGPAPTCTECEEQATDAHGCKICIPRSDGIRGKPAMCLLKECRISAVEGSCIAIFDDLVTYTATLPEPSPGNHPNAPQEIEWTVGRSAEPKTGYGESFSFIFESIPTVFSYTTQLAASCQFDAAQGISKDIGVAFSCEEYEPLEKKDSVDSTLGRPESIVEPTFGWANSQLTTPPVRSCVVEAQWTERFQFAQYSHNTGVDLETDANGNIMVVLQDPSKDNEITAENCDDVLRDLTPSIPSYGTLIAPYVKYIPEPVIVEHEAFHIRDFRHRVFEPIYQWMINRQASFDVEDCSYPNKYAVVHAEFEAERDRLIAEYQSVKRPV